MQGGRRLGLIKICIRSGGQRTLAVSLCHGSMQRGNMMRDQSQLLPGPNVYDQDVDFSMQQCGLCMYGVKTRFSVMVLSVQGWVYTLGGGSGTNM